MDILERMNTVIAYVEGHIMEEISLSGLAQLVCCSTYDLQRMFTFIAGISLVEYIRKRRLSLAALELQQSSIKVIDLALKYGYDSPVSFTRAFQAVHGVTPSQARKSNVTLKMFPELAFQITVIGVNAMNYRIVKTQPFQVFGVEGLISTSGERGYYANVGEFWRENSENGTFEKLFRDAGGAKPPMYDTMFVKDMCRVHGMGNYKKINDTTYGYMECSLTAPDSKTGGYQTFEVPAATWAVFPSAPFPWGDVGTVLNNLYRRFYSEWLPTSEYEKADGPEFEMYGGAAGDGPKDGYIEIWMPVVKGE